MSTPRSFPPSNIDDPYSSRDTGLDDTIESSFPASDPPSSIPDPTSHPGESAASDSASLIARLPSDKILWAAVGAMGALLLLGICNRAIRQLGRDRYRYDPA